MNITACPNCGGANIYQHTTGLLAEGPVQNYLPDLGGFLRYAKLFPTICKDCGLVRFFTSDDACSKLEDSPAWKKVALQTK